MMTAIKCSEEVLAVAEGSNQFMLDTHQKIYLRNRIAAGNIFYSGLSMSSMLTMMWESYPDTKSDAAQRLLKFLRLSPTKEHLFTPGYSEVLKNYERLTYGPNDASLSIVNKMYTSDDLGALKDEFLAKVHGDYRCIQTAVNFNNIPAAIEKINGDFSKDTNDLVKEVVKEGQITTNSKIVLVSSFVFRGIWEVPFKAEETTTSKFTTLNHSTVEVQMMHKKRAPGMSYTNFRNMGCHACAMYFEGFRYCMIVVRPLHASNEFINNLSPKNLKDNLMPDKLIAHFKRYHRKSRRGEGGLLVNIALPRFQISSTHILNRPFAEIEDSPFSITSTNYAEAFANLPRNANPSLTEVIQKCVIEIDERGATQSDNSAPMLPPRPSWKSRPKCVKMIVDRSFYFVLFDYTNNFLLAAGVINNPNIRE